MRRLATGWALVLLLMLAGRTVAAAAELTFAIKIEHGRVAEATQLIRVHEGDIVMLRLTSDRALVVHLHGYDIERRVAANAVTEMAFTAYATGRFPIEIHTPEGGAGGRPNEDAPLAVIEVHPR